MIRLPELNLLAGKEESRISCMSQRMMLRCSKQLFLRVLDATRDRHNHDPGPSNNALRIKATSSVREQITKKVHSGITDSSSLIVQTTIRR